MPRTETKKAKQDGKSKSTSKAKKLTGTKKGKSSTYNQYMTLKMKELKANNPKQTQKDRMQEISDSWKTDPSNSNAK